MCGTLRGIEFAYIVQILSICFKCSFYYVQTDFEDGTITMRDISFEFGGDLPNVTADNSALRLSFCCREDGSSSTAMHLPDYPFLLFKARFVHTSLFFM